MVILHKGVDYRLICDHPISKYKVMRGDLDNLYPLED